MSITQKCCTTCRNYSALIDPRRRSDGAVIYGYCFKDGDRDYNTNMGKGLPVWIDGAGCFCKSYQRKSGGGRTVTLEHAKRYLERMEQRRKTTEPCNKRAYANARELAALVSVAEYGAEPYAKMALKAIKSI